MQVLVNGRSTEIDPTTTVADLVAERGDGARRVAVAVNGEVVPRTRWETTGLTTGDSIEVLAPIAGG